MDLKKRIGEKIKKQRESKGMTQKVVCGDYMTRNMLSLIESGAAQPSLDTLVYLSEKLDIPLSHILADDESLFFYEKSQMIPVLQKRFVDGDYPECMAMIDKIVGTDSELDYIYAFSAFEYGKQMLKNGSFGTAQSYLGVALEKARSTVYNTDEIEVVVPLYLAIAGNLHSPLLEFDSKAYLDAYDSAYDREFFKYVTMDTEFEFKDPVLAKHIEAKKLIKRYNYLDAIDILLRLTESNGGSYNAYVTFGIYTDLENAYKQIGDFENAYRYASKRMTLLNAFKD